MYVQNNLEYTKPIKVGNGVWIGGNAIICDGVTIGNNVTIGAGSVVTKDIPANCIAVGNPCKVIKKSGNSQSKSPIEFVGLGHINIVVMDIDDAISYYQNLFGATPIQMFRNFKNVGFAKAAGFLKNPENIELSIAFLKIQNVNLTIEIMQYHTPETHTSINRLPVFEVSGVRHVALKVRDVYAAYKHIVSQCDISPINLDSDYKPHKIDRITVEEITLFNRHNENEEKQKICQTVDQIHYCYFVDKFGVQWEFEQGNTDIGE